LLRAAYEMFFKFLPVANLIGDIYLDCYEGLNLGLMVRHLMNLDLLPSQIPRIHAVSTSVTFGSRSEGHDFKLGILQFRKSKSKSTAARYRSIITDVMTA